jgi:plasmid stabilization system protein ParE
MSRAICIGPRARIDADDIFNWLAHRSIQGAISWYLAFGRAVERIQAAPESCALAQESLLLRRELRQELFKTRRGRLYRVVFQSDKTAVTILRIRGPGPAPLRRRDVPSE